MNSLGLTEAQPENNVQRIVLEALAVTLGRDARARAMQLPAWNEALGLPRPWDQQWSLRIQQVLAYETDVLEYPDIFEGSKVMEALVEELLEGARAEMAVVAEHGGAVEAVPYMKARARRLPPRADAPDRERRADRRRAEPLHRDRAVAADRRRRGRHPRRRPRGGEPNRSRRCARWRAERDQAAGRARARRARTRAARTDENLMPADDRRRPRRRDDRRVGGHAARGVRQLPGPDRRRRGDAPRLGDGELRGAARARSVAALGEQLGRRPKILVGKPGLDGHSNGAEQIAVRARDAGMDVVYEGIRLTPAQIAASALQEGVHVVGLSILSGSHHELIPAVIDALREAGVQAPVVVGGIIPEQDVAALKRAGVAAVYTPKDFDIRRIMRDIVELVGERNGATAR